MIYFTTFLPKLPWALGSKLIQKTMMIPTEKYRDYIGKIGCHIVRLGRRLAMPLVRLLATNNRITAAEKMEQ